MCVALVDSEVTGTESVPLNVARSVILARVMTAKHRGKEGHVRNGKGDGGLKKGKGEGDRPHALQGSFNQRQGWHGESVQRRQQS